MLKAILISLFFLSANSAQIKEFTITSFDKTPILYQKAGNGEQVLFFVHCWSCDKSYWQNTVEYLSADYTTIAIDLAGHGESGLGRTEWTIENYAKDVKAVIGNENMTDVILIGHSMGGPVVLAAAQQMSGKVKALIAVDTFQDIDNVVTEEQFGAFIKPFEDDFTGTTKTFVRNIFGEDADSNLVLKISDDMSSAPPEVALPSFRSLFEFEEARIFDQTDIPVRFINSTKFPTNTESAKKHIKDFGLTLIKDAGHFPMLEKPDEFNKRLEEILISLRSENTR